MNAIVRMATALVAVLALLLPATAAQARPEGEPTLAVRTRITVVPTTEAIIPGRGDATYRWKFIIEEQVVPHTTIARMIATVNYSYDNRRCPHTVWGVTHSYRYELTAYGRVVGWRWDEGAEIKDKIPKHTLRFCPSTDGVDYMETYARGHLIGCIAHVGCVVDLWPKMWTDVYGAGPGWEEKRVDI